jgi:hypothetical protein
MCKQDEDKAKEIQIRRRPKKYRKMYRSKERLTNYERSILIKEAGLSG